MESSTSGNTAACVRAFALPTPRSGVHSGVHRAFQTPLDFNHLVFSQYALLPYHTTSFSSHLSARPHHHRHPPPPSAACTHNMKQARNVLDSCCVCMCSRSFALWCTLPPHARTHSKSLHTPLAPLLPLSHPPSLTCSCQCPAHTRVPSLAVALSPQPPPPLLAAVTLAGPH